MPCTQLLPPIWLLLLLVAIPTQGSEVFEFEAQAAKPASEPEEQQSHIQRMEESPFELIIDGEVVSDEPAPDKTRDNSTDASPDAPAPSQSPLDIATPKPKTDSTQVTSDNTGTQKAETNQSDSVVQQGNWLYQAAPDAEEKFEPNWVPEYYELAVPGVSLYECCARATRAVKMMAQDLCAERDMKSWRVEIVDPIGEEEMEPDLIHQKCYAYVEDRANKEPVFECHARAMAKCYHEFD